MLASPGIVPRGGHDKHTTTPEGITSMLKPLQDSSVGVSWVETARGDVSYVNTWGEESAWTTYGYLLARFPEGVHRPAQSTETLRYVIRVDHHRDDVERVLDDRLTLA